MLVIASNITTRDPKVEEMFRKLKLTDWVCEKEPVESLRRLAKRCAARADVIEINTQQHHDLPSVVEAAVKIAQQATDRQLCLSSNNGDALEAGLRVCNRSPIVNYVSVDEKKLSEVFPLVVKHNAEVVLLVSDPSAPTDAREMLGKAAVLIGAARGMGIPAGRIFIDPGLIHITNVIGQRHLVEIKEFLVALPETFNFPVRSTCWLSNASAGASKPLRAIIETALLAVLGELGLASVFMDALSKDHMRVARLVKLFKNESIYSEGELEL